MSKVKEWEYNDAMTDYLKWQDELEKLLNEEEPDEASIEEAKRIIADYEDALFGDDDDYYDYDDEEDNKEDYEIDDDDGGIIEFFKDVETNETLTNYELKTEYEKLKANGDTEAENFDMYLESCLRGTLRRLSELRNRKGA